MAQSNNRPPSANENDDLSDTSVDDSDGDDEEEDIPVLPSVKQLANKFQILNPCQTQPVEPTKQVTPLIFDWRRCQTHP